ncbi:hypothetical protein, partial [Pseudomonas aeruginosa]|uniref:hypothetical protein n=1 Tax=Pseudomonas aeruginosa TaxID=287 RepID=UPI00397A11EE
LVNRQSLAARERIALEAAHIDNAGVIEAGVEPDERRNARGDLELRSGTLRNAGSLVASRALEAKASQALDNQGGSLKEKSAISCASSGLFTRVLSTSIRICRRSVPHGMAAMAPLVKPLERACIIAHQSGICALL